MTHLHLQSIFGEHLHLREVVRNIRQRIAHHPEVELDFEDVIFVTRSFADELHNLLEEREGLRLLHLNPDVSRMLEIVKHSRQNPTPPPAPTGETYIATSESELKALLLS